MLSFFKSPRLKASATLIGTMAIIVSCMSGKQTKPEFSTNIDPKGNTWVVNDPGLNREMITDSGVVNWNDASTILRTYFKTDTVGVVNIGLIMKLPEGPAKYRVTVGERTHEISVSLRSSDTVVLGSYKLKEKGYHALELQGLQSVSGNFGEIRGVLLGGTVLEKGVTYVKDDFYWGRRGPSVHMNYTLPENKDIEYFYNEITVPEGEDVEGSYFMSNGFGEGYFGIQVNSPSERRILFSVWSPFNTDDPNSIPDDHKILLLKKGEGVNTGEFGNEGSGGQSYKVFDWKAGNTYKFLLKGMPSVNNSTDYTAYFYAPEEGKWQLIASFRRPQTSTYLKRFHSFLENFLTETGYLSRMAFYGNQWARDKEGNWYELTSAKFTADATARKGARLDYKGGSYENMFFMQNCGFFSENTSIDSFHERKPNGIAPQIDFTKLD